MSAAANRPIVLLFALLTLLAAACTPAPIPYGARRKGIEPGFHLLGHNGGIYRLKYLGERDASIEEARTLWFHRASQICVGTTQAVALDERRIVGYRYLRMEHHGLPADMNICAPTGLITGILSCWIIPSLHVDYYFIDEVRYPEVEGYIDCNAKEVESADVVIQEELPL
jgi:hypothetical protein